MKEDMVELQRSIKNGPYETIMITKELADALSDYRKCSDAIAFMFTRLNMNKDEISKLPFGDRILDCNNVFKKYKLDKIELGAKYIFE